MRKQFLNKRNVLFFNNNINNYNYKTSKHPVSPVCIDSTNNDHNIFINKTNTYLNNITATISNCNNSILKMYCSTNNSNTNSNTNTSHSHSHNHNHNHNHNINNNNSNLLKSFFIKYKNNNINNPLNSLSFKERLNQIEEFVKPFIEKVDDISKSVVLSKEFEKSMSKLVADDIELLESIFQLRMDLDSSQQFQALGDSLVGFESSLVSILKSALTNDQLVVQPIDPMFTHPDILKQMIENEAVHPYTNHNQIFDRIRSGRLCLVLFHRRLPKLPLMSLYIALTQGIADNMNIINEKQVDLAKVDSAMFYSISSLHKGLKNVDLGHILISRATEYLQINPQIKNFCTLSPIPNFRNYLKRKSTHDDSIKELVNISQSNISDYKDSLTSACVGYLFLEKKKNNKAMDPVCNFHLKNGASIYRLNWSGDTSSQRINESYGMMVNYLYLPSLKSSNSNNYKQNGIITHQKPIDQLVDQLNISIH